MNTDELRAELRLLAEEAPQIQPRADTWRRGRRQSALRAAGATAVAVAGIAGLGVFVQLAVQSSPHPQAESGGAALAPELGGFVPSVWALVGLAVFVAAVGAWSAQRCAQASAQEFAQESAQQSAQRGLEPPPPSTASRGCRAKSLLALALALCLLGWAALVWSTRPPADASPAALADRGVPDRIWLPTGARTQRTSSDPAGEQSALGELRTGRASLAWLTDRGELVLVNAEDQTYRSIALPGSSDLFNRVRPITLGSSLRLSPDGGTVAFGYARPHDGSAETGVGLIDLESGAVRYVPVREGAGVMINEVSWSANSRWLGWQGLVTKRWTESSRSYLRPGEAGGPSRVGRIDTADVALTKDAFAADASTDEASVSATAVGEAMATEQVEGLALADDGTLVFSSGAELRAWGADMPPALGETLRLGSWQRLGVDFGAPLAVVEGTGRVWGQPNRSFGGLVGYSLQPSTSAGARPQQPLRIMLPAERPTAVSLAGGPEGTLLLVSRGVSGSASGSVAAVTHLQPQPVGSGPDGSGLGYFAPEATRLLAIVGEHGECCTSPPDQLTVATDLLSRDLSAAVRPDFARSPSYFLQWWASSPRLWVPTVLVAVLLGGLVVAGLALAARRSGLHEFGPHESGPHEFGPHQFAPGEGGRE